MADLAITKAAAATRLMDAGIRMFLAGDDSLATHVVLSSSLRIFADLLRQTGGDFYDTGFSMGLFTLGEAHLRGALPAFATDNPPLAEIAREVAAAIERGELTRWEDLNFEFNNSQRKAFWKNLSKQYNFLKHADLDYDKAILEADVDNKRAIYNVVGAYLMLFSGQVTAGITSFKLYEAWLGLGPKHDWMEPILDGARDLDEFEFRELLANTLRSPAPSPLSPLSAS